MFLPMFVETNSESFTPPPPRECQENSEDFFDPQEAAQPHRFLASANRQGVQADQGPPQTPICPLESCL
jgi:hypothetical protein